MDSDNKEIADKISALDNASPQEIRELLLNMKEMVSVTLKPNLEKKINKNPKTQVDKGTYYSLAEAQKFIPVLDAIEESKSSREIRYCDYPQFTPNTIWAKVNQAIRYIIENLDTPELKYLKLRNCIKIVRHDAGIILQYVHNPFAEVKGWVTHEVETLKLVDHKQRVLKFMEESNEGETLDIKEGLDLKEEEVQYFKGLFSNSPIFLAYIATNRIKIVHSIQNTNETPKD